MKTPTPAFAATVPGSSASTANLNKKRDANAPATLADFTNFHGMLCSPATANRCINAFEGGTILFMPSSYTQNDFKTFDCSARGALNPISYYLLVLLSLTGLSTLLRMTKFRMAKEYPVPTATEGDTDNNPQQRQEVKADELTSEFNDKLKIEDYVLEHCKKHTNAKSLYLKRRFEYNFRLTGGFDVVMLHLECDQKKLHLVEVFYLNNSIWRNYIAPFFLGFGKWFLRFNKRNQQKAKKVV